MRVRGLRADYGHGNCSIVSKDADADVNSITSELLQEWPTRKIPTNMLGSPCKDSVPTEPAPRLPYVKKHGFRPTRSNCRPDGPTCFWTRFPRRVLGPETSSECDLRPGHTYSKPSFRVLPASHLKGRGQKNGSVTFPVPFLGKLREPPSRCCVTFMGVALLQRVALKSHTQSFWFAGEMKKSRVVRVECATESAPCRRHNKFRKARRREQSPKWDHKSCRDGSGQNSTNNNSLPSLSATATLNPRCGQMSCSSFHNGATRR